jgi:hypothetical protein
MVKKKKTWSVPEKVKHPKFSIKKEKYVVLLLAIETAIYEMFVITRRELTDQEVIESLERLAELTHRAVAPAKDEVGITSYLYGRLVKHLEEKPQYTQEEVVESIKELIGSVKTRHDMGRGRQGYLLYLEGFLNQMGITVREATREQLEEMGIEPPDEE